MHSKAHTTCKARKRIDKKMRAKTNKNYAAIFVLRIDRFERMKWEFSGALLMLQSVYYIIHDGVYPSTKNYIY